MAFVPRLSEYSPSAMRPDNPWWYSSGNIYYGSYPHTYGMPNCTCYCYGRTGEILGNFNTDVPANDAGEWLNDVIRTGVLQWGYAPALGGIMVYRDRPDAYVHNAGHVSQVEQINPDGSVVTSNSGWQNPNYFWTETVAPDSTNPEKNYLSPWMTNPTHDYIYQGCIYVYSPPTPPPPPPPISRRKLPIWMLLRYRNF